MAGPADGEARALPGRGPPRAAAASAALALTVSLAPTADASPPAGWAPDAAAWSRPLAAAEESVRDARSAASGGAFDAAALDRAATWLSLVPDHATTARLKHALALEVELARGDTEAAWRRAQVQLEGCLPLDEAPWAEHAVTRVALGVRSATTAWALLARGPFVPSLADAWLERDAPPELEASVRRRLLIEAPDHPAARAAADELGWPGVAALIPDLEARVRRAEGLLDAHDNDRARAEALAWLEASSPPPALACRLAYVAGRAARKARRYSDALRQLSDARSRCEVADDTDSWLRATLLEAQVRRILSQPQAVRRLWELAHARAPAHSFLDDLLFLQADALEGSDRSREAAAVHRELLQRYPEGDMAATSAWRLARAALDRAPDAARTWLEQAAELTRPGTRDHERAVYWRARLDEAVRPDAARAAYASLFRRMGYYGLLARMRLTRLAPAAVRELESELRAAATSRPSTGSPPPGVRRIAATARLLRDDAWASAVLEELACRADPERRFEIAAVLVELDDHAAAQRTLRPAEPDVLTEVGQPSVDAWRTAYSRPHFEAVEEAARAAGVDPWLLLGLAREESTFDAEIISWAGAIGLTQLMPPTAMGAHAAVLRRPLSDLDALTDPALNLRLGAHVLREGFDRWGQAPLAISAYNAGNGLTSRFVRGAPRPLDRFVEDISVRQTRGYVKRVLESWARYRLLYGDDPFVRLPNRVAPR